MIERNNEYHVFISYSSKDSQITFQLYNNLLSSGLNCYMAPFSNIPMERWRKQLDDSIDSCQCVLLVATDNAVKSGYVQNEIAYAIKKNKPVFALHFPDVKFKKHSVFAKVQSTFHQMEVSEDKLLSQHQSIFDYICQQLNLEKEYKPIFTRESKIDRPELVKTVADLFEKEKCAVLCGIDGIGKTTLANQFLLDWATKNFRPVLRINSAGMESFEAEIKNYLFDPGINIDVDIQTILRRFEKKITNNKLVLLFDDVRGGDVFEMIFSFVISKEHPCIVTTNRSDLDKSFDIKRFMILLSGMKKSEAKALVNRYIDTDAEEGFESLYDISDGIPLALEIAGAYMSSNKKSLKEYVDDLSRNHALLSSGDINIPVKCHRALYNIVETAWNSITSESGNEYRLAANIIGWCSALDPASVRRDDLSQIIALACPELAVYTDQALSVCWSNSLLNKDAVSDTQESSIIAPVVQIIIRDLFEKKDKDEWKRLCVEAAQWLESKWQQCIRNELYFKKSKALFLNSSCLIGHLTALEEDEKVGMLLRTVYQLHAECALFQGNFSTAEKSIGAISDISCVPEEKRADDLVHAMSMLFLARIYESKRENKTAFEKLAKAKEYLQTEQNRSEYPIRWLMCCIVEIYLDENTDATDDEEKMAETALKFLKSSEGQINEPENTVLYCLIRNKMANIKNQKGEYAEAEKIYADIFERSCSDDYRKASGNSAIKSELINKINREFNLFYLNRFHPKKQRNAIDEMKSAIDELEKLFPFEPEVLYSMTMLGCLYLNAKKYAKCYQTNDEMQSKIKEIFGESTRHPYLVIAESGKIAALNRMITDPSRIIDEVEPWLDLLKEFDHPDCIESSVLLLVSLAQAYQKKNNTDKAKNVVHRVRLLLDSHTLSEENSKIYNSALDAIERQWR